MSHGIACHRYDDVTVLYYIVMHCIALCCVVLYCIVMHYVIDHIILCYIRESGVRTNIILTTCAPCGERKNMEEEEVGKRKEKEDMPFLFLLLYSTSSPFLFLLSLSLTLLLFYFSSSPPIILFRHLDIYTPMRVEKGFLKYLRFRLQLVIRRYPRQHSQLHADLR